MNKKRPFIFGGALLVLIVVGVLGILGFSRVAASLFIYPNRQPMTKNPGDYGLEYEDVSIETDDGVTLSGWLMMGDGDDVAIICHPLTFSKYGYSIEHEGALSAGYDHDVEFIPTAKHLVDAGYTVLMYDLRHHGESGEVPGGGPFDALETYHDVTAAVTFVSEHPDLAGSDIALVSFCFSSVAGMITMSREPEVLEDAGIKALVAVQPISTRIFYERYGLPDFIIEQVDRITVKEGAPAFDDYSPLLFAGDVFVPVLFVQSLEDPWSDIAFSQKIFDAFPTEKEAIWLEGEMHRFDTYNWFNDHPEPLLDFLDRHMNREDTAAGE
jgi:dipeptidyl aminopeptidase/acylaminoacyl peptidase